MRTSLNKNIWAIAIQTGAINSVELYNHTDPMPYHVFAMNEKTSAWLRRLQQEEWIDQELRFDETGMAVLLHPKTAWSALQLTVEDIENMDFDVANLSHKQLVNIIDQFGEDFSWGDDGAWLLEQICDDAGLLRLPDSDEDLELA